MAEKKSRLTKPCPKCGYQLDVNRFVCKECGYVFPWFQIRLYLGGCGILFFIFAMGTMVIMSLMGGK